MQRVGTGKEWIGDRSSRIPAVTIGVPVYNGEAHLGRALESLLQQSFGDFEILISDNASEDETWRVCREYAGLDPRVRAVRQDLNLGANGNFNFLFRAARGEFFKWAGHDDQWDRGFLKACVDALRGDPASVLAYCGEAYFDEDDAALILCNEPYHVDSSDPHQRFRQWMWAMESPKEGRSDLVYGLIRSSALQRTRLFTNTLFTNQLLVLELAALGSFHYIPQVLVRRTPAPHRTIDERLVRMEPGHQRKISIPHWKLAAEFMRVARSLPIGFARKATLQLDCMRFFTSGTEGRRLVWDIRRSARNLSRRSYRNTEDAIT